LAAGLRPDPQGSRELTALPRPSSCIGGVEREGTEGDGKGRRGEGTEREIRAEERRGEEGKGPHPLYKKIWIRHWPPPRIACRSIKISVKTTMQVL